MTGPGNHDDDLLNLLDPEPEPDEKYSAIKECLYFIRASRGQGHSCRSRSRSRSRSTKRAGSEPKYAFATRESHDMRYAFATRDQDVTRYGDLRRDMMKKVTESALLQLQILEDDCDRGNFVLQLHTEPSHSCELVDLFEDEDSFDTAYQHCVQTIASLAHEKFYVGITKSPTERWHWLENGHKNFWHQIILLVATTGPAAGRLEVALVEFSKQYHTCENKGIHRRDSASIGQPASTHTSHGKYI